MAAVILAKEVETLEAQETMRLDAIRDAADARVMRPKLAEAERKLAALKEPVKALRAWLENDEPGIGMGLVEDMWAVVNILDGKGE